MGKIEPPELVGGNCLLLKLDNPEQYLAFVNHQLAIDLVRRYNAFEKGGAVERLGEWAYRVLRVHVPVQDYLYENGRAILAELEALLPKKEGG